MAPRASGAFSESVSYMASSPIETSRSIAAIVVAAGRGERARQGEGGGPKQYAPLKGKTVLDHAVAAFAGHPAIGSVTVVIHPDDHALYTQSVMERETLRPPVEGGETRQASVLAGLQSLAASPPDYVLIHDAARPAVSAEVIDRVCDGLAPGSGVLAAVPVADTLKSVADGTVVGTVDRTGLWAAQTPQGFDFPALLQAHREARKSGRDFTDDAGIAEWAGMAVRVSVGSRANMKITQAGDLGIVGAMMGTEDICTGSGFDVHGFEPGDGVTLGGCFIAHTAKLKGHSDADVVLHALTDALLGAVGAGDIGQHFPPSDPQWRDADSARFLAHALDLVTERGGRLVNLDLTIICEAPKIGPHRDAIRARVAELCGLAADRVNIKATTTEGLGFTGRREGIAAMASANVALPRT